MVVKRLIFIVILNIIFSSCIHQGVENENWNSTFVDSVTFDKLEGDFIVKKSYIIGRLFKQETFNNDKKNGWTIEYYPDKSIQSETYYTSNKRYGSRYRFYPNGNPKSYNCFDFEENNRRVKMYDLSGNIIRDEGKILGQASYLTSDFKFKRGSNAIIDIVVSTPFNESVEVNLVLKKGLDTIRPIQIAEIRNNTVFFKCFLNEAGEYNLIGIAKSIDTIAHKVYHDTLVAGFEMY